VGDEVGFEYPVFCWPVKDERDGKLGKFPIFTFLELPSVSSEAAGVAASLPVEGEANGIGSAITSWLKTLTKKAARNKYGFILHVSNFANDKN
jgi:hypothetical protein